MVRAGKPKQQIDPALAWARENGLKLPPAEPQAAARTKSLDQTKSGRSLHDQLSDEGPALADMQTKRANLGQAPDGFDVELGVVMPGSAQPEPEDHVRRRWVRLATELLPLIGAGSGYRPVMPVATPPDDELAAAAGSVTARLASALPEMEALHRKLLPGWREPVRVWLQQILDRKVEERYRPVAAKSRKPGLKNSMPLVQIEPPQRLLETLRVRTGDSARHPVIGDDVPNTLTATMLTTVAARVGRKQAGSWSVDVAIAKLEAWCRDPQAYAKFQKQNSD